MKTELYQRYLAHRTAGRKRDASDTIREFVASCTGPQDRQEWVRQFLEDGGHEHRIRHEVYESLVFPVLLDGYVRRDFWSIYWLAKTASSLYAASSLHAQLEYKAERQLFREAFELQPTSEIRRCLLEAYLAEFSHCQHEWPAGILYGMDGATIDDCADLLQDVDFVRSLDDGANEHFLKEFEERVHTYRERLTRAA